MEEEDGRTDKKKNRKFSKTKQILEEAQQLEILIGANGEAAIWYYQWKHSESHFSCKEQINKYLLSLFIRNARFIHQLADNKSSLNIHSLTCPLEAWNLIRQPKQASRESEITSMLLYNASNSLSIYHVPGGVWAALQHNKIHSNSVRFMLLGLYCRQTEPGEVKPPAQGHLYTSTN